MHGPAGQPRLAEVTELVLIANAEDGSISSLRLHRGDRPRLETLTTTSGLQGCGTFAVDIQRDLVHAAYKGDPAGIATLRLNRGTGELTEVSRRDVESSLSYLSLTPQGTVLLGASYGGGFGATWPVELDDEPALGERVSRISYNNVHCVVPAARPDGSSGLVAYFVALGDDLVAQYAVDEQGTLVPLDPVAVSAPEGCGPRHLIVDGANAYLITEYSGDVFRLRRHEDGTLERVEAVGVVNPEHGLRHSRMGADPTQEHLIWGADLRRAGEWLITSERSSSELASVAVQADGRLGEVVAYTPTQRQPRGFNVTDDGAFVIAVGEKATQAELLAVESDGSLTSLGTADIGNGANWVRILP